MAVKIAKEFEWEMSHRLPFHKGLCKNIHGHSYRLRVVLEGDVDSQDILLDYYDVIQIVQPMIDQLDHAFVCDKGDEMMTKIITENNLKHYFIEGYSTSENLAKIFAETFAPKFHVYENINKLTIRIYETRDAFAEYCIDLKNEE